MPTRTDRALLLKRTPFGESSLVAHVLTREHGRVHVLAKGAYRHTSRYFGVLDFFDTLELTWSHAPRRDLDLLTSGDRGVRRKCLAEDLTAYRTALTVLELCELGARRGQPDPRLFDLAAWALDALVEGTHHPDLTLVVFELRFLQNLGLEPALADCASCGGSAEPLSEEPRRAAFSAGAGGRLCRRCAQEARRSGRRVGTMPAEVLETAHLLTRRATDQRADPTADEALSKEQIPGPDMRTRLRDFIERFLDYHLETRPKSHRVFLAAPNRNAPERDPLRTDRERQLPDRSREPTADA